MSVLSSTISRVARGRHGSSKSAASRGAFLMAMIVVVAGSACSGGAGEIGPDDFCRSFARALCGHLTRCCTDAELTELGDDCSEGGGILSTLPQACAQYYRLSQEAGATYDGAAAAACLAGINEALAPCPGYAASGFPRDEPGEFATVEPACGRILAMNTGGPPGTTCGRTLDCRDGWCNLDSHTCEALGGSGDPCGTCEPGLICADGICYEVAGEDQPCDGNRDCEFRFYCDGGACRPRLAPGDSCTGGRSPDDPCVGLCFGECAEFCDGR